MTRGSGDTPEAGLIEAARAALKERRHEAASALLQRRLEVAPEDVEALCLGALAAWRGTGDVDTAEAHLRRARALAGEDPRVLSLSAELSLRLGRIEATRDFASRALAADPDHVSAYVSLARADAGGVADAALGHMRRLADSGGAPAPMRGLWNAIGRVLEARREYDAAFAAFAASNRLARERYDRAGRENRLAEARALFTEGFFRERRGLGLRGAGCVFVLGMPRSGSTLLAQMLAAHPDMANCGESDALPEVNEALHRRVGARAYFNHVAALDARGAEVAARAYLAESGRGLRPADAPRRVDKRLGNYLNAPLIRLLFPDAALLHARRHPLDLCVACFKQDFDGHAYANDLADLAHYYLLYHQYMRLWSERLDQGPRHCRHETLARDFEPEARAICAAVGLPWNPACAAPHRAAGFVNTASAAQVRQPVHARGIGRWRVYERHLRPLIEGLGGLAEVARLDAAFD